MFLCGHLETYVNIIRNIIRNKNILAVKQAITFYSFDTGLISW